MGPTTVPQHLKHSQMPRWDITKLQHQVEEDSPIQIPRVPGHVRGDTISDARARINAAWLKWRQVTGVLCDKKMPEYLKAKVYKTVVRPVALYGAKCWPATKKHELALHAMEMKMLHAMEMVDAWADPPRPHKE